jgi:hypothetical protein
MLPAIIHRNDDGAAQFRGSAVLNSILDQKDYDDVQIHLPEFVFKTFA